MTDAALPLGGSLTTADGQPLTVALARAQRRAKWRAFLLVLPLLAFVLISFVVPIVQMLHRSVYHDGLSASAPRLAAWFADHPAGTAPDEAAFEALVLDLRQMREDKTQGLAGTRVNYDYSGARSMFTSGARDAARVQPPYREAMLAEDKAWGDPLLWQAMRDSATGYTSSFYLSALDLAHDGNGEIVPVEGDLAIYRKLFVRTFVLSAVITAITLVLGFPIAHLLATLPLRKSNLLMMLVLLPFWTSLLVRTTSWIVLLQKEGVLNNTLVALGVIGEDGRIPMMYNQVGTIVAMTHVLLPFTVLPLYSVMRTINPSYVRAARSLGATSWTAFRRVYLPLTVPGIAAGALLVYILSVGYYITPALVGGASGQLISNLIAFHMSKSNWSSAAAIAALLLAAVLLLYWLYDRLVGIDKLKLG
jgi:putative spermidine/putrescine transport system permease protein